MFYKQRSKKSTGWLICKSKTGLESKQSGAALFQVTKPSNVATKMLQYTLIFFEEMHL